MEFRGFEQTSHLGLPKQKGIRGGKEKKGLVFF
jgi:hypothetical protein